MHDEDSSDYRSMALDAGYKRAEEMLLSIGYDHVVRLSSNPENGMWERIRL